MSIPMSEFGTPETLGAGGVRLQPISYGTAPLVSGKEESDEVWLRQKTQLLFSVGAAIGITECIDLEYSCFFGLGQGTRVGVKWQFLGENHYFDDHRENWIGSVTARYTRVAFRDLHDPGEGSDDFAAAGDLLHLSIPIGCRLIPAASWYAGPKLIIGEVKISHPAATARGWSLSRSGYLGYGGFVGIGLHPHSRHIGIELLTEVYLMNLPTPEISGRAWYPCFNLALALPFHF
jgi:hypothetical protein